jgi:hypothetical protein
MPARMSHKSPSTEYSVHPAVLMIQKAIAGLREKTGRTIEQWVEFIDAEGPAGEIARREWLKKKHGLGTNYAGWLAERSVGRVDEYGDSATYLKAAGQYVEAMFAGAKAGLRPIYEELLRAGRALGGDVRVCPCQTMVPLYRQHVIAQIKPTTRTRIDFGLALGPLVGKKKLPARLIDTGGHAKKDRITHRIPLTAVAEIDDELKRWLKTAYDLDGKV